MTMIINSFIMYGDATQSFSLPEDAKILYAREYCGNIEVSYLHNNVISFHVPRLFLCAVSGVIVNTNNEDVDYLLSFEMFNTIKSLFEVL